MQHNVQFPPTLRFLMSDSSLTASTISAQVPVPLALRAGNLAPRRTAERRKQKKKSSLTIMTTVLFFPSRPVYSHGAQVYKDRGPPGFFTSFSLSTTNNFP